MLRIMSLNVGSLFEPEWDTRRYEVVAQILDADADIVCLQELWNESPEVGTAQWLVDALGNAGLEYHFVFGGHRFGAYTSDWRTHPLSDALNIHRKRIDYIFVGDPFRRAGNAGRVLDCRVVANDPITGVQASDHRGLVAEITWPTRPE